MFVFAEKDMDNQYYEKIKPESLINLFSQAPVALAMLMGKDFVIESANEQILQIWGKDDSVIGLPLVEALPEIKDQAFPDILLEVYETGKPFRGYKVSCFLERKGFLGEYFFDFVYSPVYDNANQIIGVSVVATEVTSQVKSEEQLAESELRFKNLILNADYSIAIYRGLDMIVELANDKMLRTWGKDRSVIGMPLEKTVPELEGQPFIDLLRKVYTTGETYSATEDRADLIVDGKLQTYFYNFSYKPIRNNRNEVYAILNMAVNVTDMVNSRKKLQEKSEKLRLSEAKDKGLSEAMPQIVWTSAANGNFTYLNERAKEYFDITDDFIGAKNFSIFIHPEDLPKVEKVWKKAVKKKSQYEIEYRAKNKSGEYIWLLTRAVPDLDEDGNVNQWIGTSIDINELKILQAQKDTFLGIASHELKTPLTSIKLYAQVLDRMLTKQGDSKTAEYAKKMDEQVVKLTSLIGDLLDVTKINSGKIQLNEDNFNIAELVDEIVEEQQLTSRHKITVEKNSVGTVYADKHRVSQVITNFLTNAVKYSPNADEVIVRSENDGANMVFSVRDFGLGIPDNKKDKVFEQYYRVSGEEQSTIPGLGLGLFIAAQIIERSNGKIWVESTLGKGSTFFFSLPLSEREN